MLNSPDSEGRIRIPPFLIRICGHIISIWPKIPAECALSVWDFVCGGAHPNERRAAAKASRVRKPLRVQCREDGLGGRSTDCVQSDIRAFGIAGDWKATALEAEV